MADPRDTISYEGIDYGAETYDNDATIVYAAAEPGGSVSVGLAVKVTAAKECGLATDGAAILGKLIQVEADGKCTVQTRGYTTLPAGNAAAVTVGKRFVGALGAASAKGYIREATTGDEIAAGDNQIVDPTTTTAVVVRL